MLRHLSIPTLAALVLSAGTAFAQDQTTETPAEDSAPAASTGFDLGEPVDQGPRPGERYAKEQFGDWDMACIRTDGVNDPCSLLQILGDSEGNAIAEISLFRIGGGGQAVAGATIVVPLETLLPAQLAISVDGGAGRLYNYSFCNPVGCVAQIGLTQEDIDAFKRGREATLSIVAAARPDAPIQLTMSLTGFTAGYDQVDVVDN
ncbi:MAG: invasion associated locus B family protein [Marinibacterium sp.]|nr:invasion associated locus B family protein [Marinibacterium sp.]